MRITYLFSLISIFLCACSQKRAEQISVTNTTSPNIIGTWKLVSAIAIVGNDTTSTYSNSQETIKIINKMHFAFLTHDLHKGKKADSSFVAGGGTYTLIGDNYKEHLAYCNFREWENKDFDFKIVLRGDTLTQIGIEKVEKLNINRKIIEKYVAWQK